MKMMDMYGAVTMEITSIEQRGDSILAKGKAFGAMPITVFLKPEEAWGGRKLLSWRLLWYLPIMFGKGWWRSRRRRAKVG
jgi:hypothetical protein